MKSTEFARRSTGVTRRCDELGRLVLPKEIRRTMRIREGDPTLTTLTPTENFCFAIFDLSKRLGINCASGRTRT